jgi:CheY-like chemotaxis protein/DNA-directed RNA polymerase subunit RPC12/RpoP
VSGIVVIEDEPLIAMMVEQMAEDLGWKVEGSARTMADAITLLGVCNPSLALIDIRLGSDTGLAVAQECSHRGIPVVFMTGDTPRDIPEIYRGNPILAKPFTSSDMAEALQSSLNREYGGFEMKDTMSEGVAICPSCHAENRLTVDSLPPNAEIHCSRCGARIGFWSDAMRKPSKAPPQGDSNV